MDFLNVQQISEDAQTTALSDLITIRAMLLRAGLSFRERIDNRHTVIDVNATTLVFRPDGSLRTIDK